MSDTMLPIANVVQNSSGQISIQDESGQYFDVSRYVGCTLYVDTREYHTAPETEEKP